MSHLPIHHQPLSLLSPPVPVTSVLFAMVCVQAFARNHSLRPRRALCLHLCAARASGRLSECLVSISVYGPLAYQFHSPPYTGVLGGKQRTLLHRALKRNRLHWEKEREATEGWSTFASYGPEPQHPQFTLHPHTASLLIVQRGCSPFFLSSLTSPLPAPHMYFSSQSSDGDLFLSCSWQGSRVTVSIP